MERAGTDSYWLQPLTTPLVHQCPRNLRTDDIGLSKLRIYSVQHDFTKLPNWWQLPDNHPSAIQGHAVLMSSTATTSAAITNIWNAALAT
jgi:hypothetical protein